MDDDAAEVRRLAGTLEKSKIAAALREKDGHGLQPLHLAAIKGSGKACAALLALDRSLLLEVSERGAMTAVHWAVARAQVVSLQALIAEGADIEARDEGQRTALHYAAARGHTALLDVLVSAGASLEAQTSNGVTALQMAAEKAQTATITALIKAGANVNAASDTGRNTPLHAAILSHHVNALGSVQALLAAGSNVEAVNSEGKTALMLAKEADDEEVVEAIQAALHKGHAGAKDEV